jgi:hypothetical protein
MTEETTVITADVEDILEAAALEDGAVFTEDEREGLYIVRAICSSEIDPSRLAEKDTQNYCNILLDGNTRKSILRMHPS